jgi:hypothetical protein
MNPFSFLDVLENEIYTLSTTRISHRYHLWSTYLSLQFNGRLEGLLEHIAIMSAREGRGGGLYCTDRYVTEP